MAVSLSLDRQCQQLTTYQRWKNTQEKRKESRQIYEKIMLYFMYLPEAAQMPF